MAHLVIEGDWEIYGCVQAVNDDGDVIALDFDGPTVEQCYTLLQEESVDARSFWRWDSNEDEFRGLLVTNNRTNITFEDFAVFVNMVVDIVEG